MNDTSKGMAQCETCDKRVEGATHCIECQEDADTTCDVCCGEKGFCPDGGVCECHGGLHDSGNELTRYQTMWADAEDRNIELQKKLIASHEREKGLVEAHRKNVDDYVCGNCECQERSEKALQSYKQSLSDSPENNE